MSSMPRDTSMKGLNDETAEEEEQEEEGRRLLGGGSSSGLDHDTGGDGSSSQWVLPIPAAYLGKRRLVLRQPRLCMQKTGLVVVASYSLVPLLMSKSSLPAWVYGLLLIVIHVLVLLVYLFRVRFMQLDADRRALAARVLGLGFSVWLLTVVHARTHARTPVDAYLVGEAGGWAGCVCLRPAAAGRSKGALVAVAD
jgi:hypothetical protein